MEATKKAVILSRVSSRDQEDGYSIEAQKLRLVEYCKRKNLEVIQINEIVESSTNGDRKKFLQIIKFIKQQKEIIALVADKIDRIQRSFKEFPLLDDLIQRGKIELHFNTENQVIHRNSVSHERLMWSIGVVMAQSYVDSLRDNVKRSLDLKVKKGECIGPAPLGYLNAPDTASGRNTVIIDPVRAPLVKRIFEEYSTGLYSMEEMAKKTKKWGLKARSGKYLSKSVIHKLLQRPFYYGDMLVKGCYHSHNYEPLIPYQLFKSCEAIRLGHNKKPFKYSGKEYIFRGLIKCVTSGKTVSSDTKKKVFANGNIGEWTYLIVHDPNNPSKKIWVKEEVVLAQVRDVLKSIGIKDKELLRDVVAHIKSTNNSKKEFHGVHSGQLKKEHTEIQDKIDKLMDLRINGELTKDEFESRKKRLKDRQHEITDLIRTYDDAEDKFSNNLISLLNLASEAYELFMGSKLEKKREIINIVFSNLELKGATLCYSLRKPFDMMANTQNRASWLREQDSNLRPID